jgi:hypothetical protein
VWTAEQLVDRPLIGLRVSVEPMQGATNKSSQDLDQRPPAGFCGLGLAPGVARSDLCRQLELNGAVVDTAHQCARFD